MRLQELEVTALDFETTGQVRGQLDIPWQIGMTRLFQGRLVPKAKYSKYLRVPRDYHFSPYTPGRWAEMREELAKCQTLIQKWPEVAPWLNGHVLVAHNAPTEQKMLRQAFPMHAFGPWLDTLRIARLAYPGLESYALSDLLDILRLKPAVDAICPTLAPHDAYYDAVACALLLQHLTSLPGWNSVTIEYLCAL